jgi:hypothetical protein
MDGVFGFVDSTTYTCGESSAGAGVGINNEARMIWPALSKCIIIKNTPIEEGVS